MLTAPRLSTSSVLGLVALLLVATSGCAAEEDDESGATDDHLEAAAATSGGTSDLDGVWYYPQTLANPFPAKGDIHMMIVDKGSFRALVVGSLLSSLFSGVASPVTGTVKPDGTLVDSKGNKLFTVKVDDSKVSADLKRADGRTFSLDREARIVCDTDQDLVVDGKTVEFAKFRGFNVRFGPSGVRLFHASQGPNEDTVLPPFGGNHLGAVDMKTSLASADIVINGTYSGGDSDGTTFRLTAPFASLANDNFTAKLVVKGPAKRNGEAVVSCHELRR